MRHILKNIMVLSVRLLYHNRVIYFQQGKYPVYDNLWFKTGNRSRPLSNSLMAPRGSGVYLIENMWRPVQKTMQETWHILFLKNSNCLWHLVSGAWDEVALSERYVRCLNRWRRGKNTPSLKIRDDGHHTEEARHWKTYFILVFRTSKWCTCRSPGGHAL
jgi:hypothetical protein